MNKIEKKQQKQIAENNKEHQKRVKAMHERIAKRKKDGDKKDEDNLDLIQETKKREKERDKEQQENEKKPKPKFKIVIMIAVWAMIIFTLLSMTLGPVSELFQSY